MAKTNEKNVSVDASTSKDIFDYSQYLPAGYDAKDLKSIGGLTPIYAAELALAQNWAPAVGWMDRITVIDMDADEKDLKQRFREFIIMQSTVKTKGIRGKRDDREIIDVMPGDDILVPMSGNIKNISVLRAALADNDKVYLGVFRVTGTKNTGRPTDMWTIESFIHPKHAPREGRFALPVGANHAPALQGGGVTSSGAVYDKDGVVQEARA